jgi:hypothetical protein
MKPELEEKFPQVSREPLEASGGRAVPTKRIRKKFLLRRMRLLVLYFGGQRWPSGNGGKMADG